MGFDRMMPVREHSTMREAMLRSRCCAFVGQGDHSHDQADRKSIVFILTLDGFAPCGLCASNRYKS
jgi:hypothetical protein